VLRFVASVVALVIASLLPLGIRFQGLFALLLTALVLGLANVFLRPVLLLLTLPLNLVSFGLFTLVVNALIFLLVARIVPGFQLAGFWSAFFGAIVVGILTSLLTIVFQML
jgi:putative membrane protein